MKPRFTVSSEIRLRFGGVVVSVLATGPKVIGFKPGRGDGFSRAMKILNTPSLAGGPMS
jgi:hypothetical protein